MKFAIIGATGNVGRKTINILENAKFEIQKLYLVASSKSSGKKLFFKGSEIEIENLDNYDFSKANITFFAAGSQISKEWIPKAAKQTIVIDNSSYFRMQKDVPLVIPEVNPDALNNHKNIISNPNCSTIQMVLALKPLHDVYKIKRVIVSTYQAVSGAGKASVDELFEQTKDYLNGKKIIPKNFSKQIAFNLIPHIDTFDKDSYTKEELKMINETKKILDDRIELTATCVRIPVLVSHAESVNIEFEKPFSLEKIYSLLDSAEGCEVYDKREDGGYITPLEAEGKNETYISRIREDKTKKNTINMWIVSDNLLRGAALNAVEIAELLIKKNNG